MYVRLDEAGGMVVHEGCSEQWSMKFSLKSHDLLRINLYQQRHQHSSRCEERIGTFLLEYFPCIQRRPEIITSNLQSTTFTTDRDSAA
jgi:hypothetical protein